MSNLNLKDLVHESVTELIAADPDSFRSLVPGPKGDDVTVTRVEQLSGHRVLIEFSDNTVFISESLQGEKGDKGNPGDEGPRGISVHHTKPTATSNPHHYIGATGHLDTYTMYGNPEETIVLGWFLVQNGKDGADGRDSESMVAYPTKADLPAVGMVGSAYIVLEDETAANKTTLYVWQNGSYSPIEGVNDSTQDLAEVHERIDDLEEAMEEFSNVEISTAPGNLLGSDSEGLYVDPDHTHTIDQVTDLQSELDRIEGLTDGAKVSQVEGNRLEVKADGLYVKDSFTPNLLAAYRAAKA